VRLRFDRRTSFAACLGLLLLALPLAAADDAAPEGAPGPASWAEALKDGEVDVAFRYRFEEVSDDAVGAADAHASTLRTTLSYGMKPYRGFSFFLEAEDVTAVVDDERYNNAGAGHLANGVRDRPVVADPEVTGVNQAWVRFARGATALTAGRQEIALGDQRFVGPVGWRQNHQSFDALRITSEVGKVKVDYAFVAAVHRIFGDRQPMASHLLNLPIDAGGAGTLTLYAYLLDYDRPQSAVLSTATYGAELRGKRPLTGRRTLLYELELAEQRDHADNPRRIDAGYANAMLGVDFGAVSLKATWEVLEGGGDGGRFTTPLATLHKWNGWADKFLATPPDGLDTLYLTVAGKAGKLGWTAVYLDFRADAGGRDFGSELDLQLTYPTPWGQTVALKAALYDAEDFAADTEKLMLWTTYRF